MEGGGRADGLGAESAGGGLMTLAFNPVAEGDSWLYRSDMQHLINDFKMYNLASDGSQIHPTMFEKSLKTMTEGYEDTFGI